VSSRSSTKSASVLSHPLPRRPVVCSNRSTTCSAPSSRCPPWSTTIAWPSRMTVNGGAEKFSATVSVSLVVRRSPSESVSVRS